MIRNQNWYNLNSTRQYPLDDNATGDVDKGGGSLPSNILVDCNIRFPQIAGRYLYVSSITVTERLATVTFLAATNVDSEASHVPTFPPSSPDTFIPVAAITVTDPEEYRPYMVEALYPGVGGWVVFGGGIKETFRALFSTPAQTLLAPQTARWYTRLPVESLQKEDLAEVLTGIVNIKAGSNVEIIKENRVIEGATKEAMVIRLKDRFDANLLEELVGPCGLRPESQNCDRTPIEFINTVEPDADGNINIRFIGPDLHTFPFEGLSEGLTADLGLGMIDACNVPDRLPGPDGELPGDPQDLCEPSSSSESEELDICPGGYVVWTRGVSPPGQPWVQSTIDGSCNYSGCSPYPSAKIQALEGCKAGYCEIDPDHSSAVDVSDEVLTCLTAYGGTCTYYDTQIVAICCISCDEVPVSSESCSSLPWGTTWDNSDVNGFVVQDGLWEFQAVDSPSEGDGFGTPTDSDVSYTGYGDYCRNVSIYDECRYPTSRDKKVWADLRITGSNGEAGLVMNWRRSPITGNPHWLYATVDLSAGELVLGRFAGGTRITLATSGSVELSQDTWYRMIVEAPEDPLDSAKTKITVKLFAMSDLVTPVVQLGPTSTTSFGSISGAPDDYTGRWGLVTYESVGQFSHFNIEHYAEASLP